MKKILVLTDFSAQAKHMAAYAYALSKQIGADIILCNAVPIPAEVSQAGFLIWGREESETLLENSQNKLKQLKRYLWQNDRSLEKKPDINTVSQTGFLQDVVSRLVSQRMIDFVVMGIHDTAFGSFLLENHTRNMIDEIGVPLILVPKNARITQFRDIFFASDFRDLHRDIGFLKRIILLADSFLAEIFIVHISTPGAEELHKKIKKIMFEICAELNYPGIRFFSVEDEKEINGLKKLISQNSMELLVMVHQPQSFLSRILRGSLSQKLAKEPDVPLLIFKAEPKEAHIA